MSREASKARQVGMAGGFAVAFSVMVAVALLMMTASASLANSTLPAPVISSPPEGSYDNDGAFTLSGTAWANSTLHVFNASSGMKVGTLKVASSGNWGLDLTGLSEGKHAYKARVSTTYGLLSTWSNTRTVIVDTQAPAAPSITAPDEGASFFEDTPIVFSGRAEPNSTIELFEGTNFQGAVKADLSGNWSKVANVGQAGSYSFKAKARDLAGNVSPWSNTRTVIVPDTKPPAPPFIISPAEGNYDNDGSFTLSGTAEANSAVELFDGGRTLVVAVPVNASGEWAYDLRGVLDGPHSYTARATDTAGNVSAESHPRTVTVDTKAPAAPSITAPEDGRSVFEGATVRFSGTAEPNSTVELFEDDDSVGTTKADASGNWSLSLENISSYGGTYYNCDPGLSYSFKARATDLAGNVSGWSNTRSVGVMWRYPPKCDQAP
jgi:chitodextrinase